MKAKTELQREEPRRPIHVPPGKGRTYGLKSGPQTALLGADDTDGVYEIIEIVGEPNLGPPLHIHRDFEETFYVLDGVLTVRVGTETLAVEAGGVLAIPAGVVHTWTNRTTRSVRFLQFTAPAKMEGLTAALSELPKGAGFDEMTALADQHGTTIVGPPL